MSTNRQRGRMVFFGPVDLGSDASIRLLRTAADKLGFGSGDSLDLKTNSNNIQLPGGTTALATATMGSATGRLIIATQGGTPALCFECNGTTFFITRTGNL